jgi:hypothetical protein
MAIYSDRKANEQLNSEAEKVHSDDVGDLLSRQETIEGFWGLSVLKRHNPLQPLSTVASRGVLTFS